MPVLLKDGGLAPCTLLSDILLPMTYEQCLKEAERLSAQIPLEKRDLALAVLNARAQFSSGLPVTATCPRCLGLLAVEHPTPAAGLVWFTSCPCAACNETLRGL